MKVEVRCRACGKGYLVEETKIPAGGGSVSCQACGARIDIKVKGPVRPAAPATAPPQAPTPAPAVAAVDGARRGEVSCPRCGLHFVPGAQAAPAPGARRTILLVEDLHYFVEIARDALSGRYEVKTARTVEEARAILAAGGIDLILLDLTLEGGQDGLRLLREPPGKVCPVLLFTAQDESEMYGEGWANLRAVGVDDVVIKGMNMGEALLRKVGDLLGDVQLQDQTLR
jgi:predicted Zn finger-like uncharacterized protein